MMKGMIGFLLMVSLVVLIGLIRWLPFRPKGPKEEMTGRATVLSKRVAQGSGSFNAGTRWDYLVTFQVGNVELELYVTQTRFKELKEGMTGVLRWQRESLVWFDPDEA